MRVGVQTKFIPPIVQPRPNSGKESVANAAFGMRMALACCLVGLPCCKAHLTCRSNWFRRLPTGDGFPFAGFIKLFPTDCTVRPTSATLLIFLSGSPRVPVIVKNCGNGTYATG